MDNVIATITMDQVITTACMDSDMVAPGPGCGPCPFVTTLLNQDFITMALRSHSINLFFGPSRLLEDAPSGHGAEPS